MTEREMFKNFDNLNEDELNTKSNKNVYVKNIIMTNIIKHCRGEKKRGIKVIDGFRKKLMIPDYEISVSIEYVVKSKIKTIFGNEKILEEYSVKIYEIDPLWNWALQKKIQVDNNDQKDILFRIDVYFSKYSLAVEIGEKGHIDRDLIFEEKRQKTLEKNLTVHLLELILVKKIMM